MRRTWVYFIVAAGCAVVLVLSAHSLPAAGSILLARDAFDPLISIIEPLTAADIVPISPYPLGGRIAGVNGLAFVFGTQARFMQEGKLLAEYTPLYSASIVIAVNREGNSAGAIDGWHSLLQSDAVVLIPDNGIESGRLAAIALARGLGGREGDLSLALQAYRDLEKQGRLNPGSEYADPDHRNAYQPHRPALYDAVIMWDYQARRLAAQDGHWDIVIPTEGTVTVDCGYVAAGPAAASADIQALREYFASPQGQSDLILAGFSPLTASTDLAAWDEARLLFNPQFRRLVRQAKLYAPASVRERLLLKSITLLLFVLAAQKVIRSVPAGPRRTTSAYALLLVLFWMLIGIMKAIALQPGPIRYFWFATYIARHGLPVLWYCMCHLQAFDRLPAPAKLKKLAVAAFLLTLLVMTNDLHRQVFVYAQADPVTWEHHYSNGWGYYLSLLWTFILSLYSLLLLFRQKITRQQLRQYLYAGLFFLLLFAYQAAYIMGIVRIIDLDIPTTVAIFIMVFILAAQRQRFMGSMLLTLPVFHNSPHAISIFDNNGIAVYRNQVMEAIDPTGDLKYDYAQTEVFTCGERVFESRFFNLENGKALILEDISDLKKLENSLAASHEKLNAVHQLLRYRQKANPVVIGRMEQDRYSGQLEVLLRKKLEEARHELDVIAEQGHETALPGLRRARFLVCICQQRLRFIIASQKEYPRLPVGLVVRYGEAVMENGGKIGLDGAFSALLKGNLYLQNVAGLLDALDGICLFALSIRNSSLIIRLESGISFISLDAAVTLEDDSDPGMYQAAGDSLIRQLSGLDAAITRQITEDGLAFRLKFSGREVSG